MQSMVSRGAMPPGATLGVWCSMSSPRSRLVTDRGLTLGCKTIGTIRSHVRWTSSGRSVRPLSSALRPTTSRSEGTEGFSSLSEVL